MPIGSKFARPAASANAPAANRRSRYAGIVAAQPRDPMLAAGLYRVRVVECQERSNPRNGTWYHASLEVVEVAEGASAVAERVTAIWQVEGSGAASGRPKVKAFVMAAAGFADEGEFNGYDPDGLFIDATVGAANEYSARGDSIVGRLVDVRVIRGKDTGTGDFFREYDWSPVDDTEQQ